MLCCPRPVLESLLRLLSEEQSLRSEEFVFIYVDMFASNTTLLSLASADLPSLPSLLLISLMEFRKENLDILKLKAIKTYQVSTSLVSQQFNQALWIYDSSFCVCLFVCFLLTKSNPTINVHSIHIIQHSSFPFPGLLSCLLDLNEVTVSRPA